MKEVEALIPRHETMLAFLRKERDNLAVALQVLDNLDKRPAYLDPIRLPAEGDARSETTKPEGTPTVPNMIIEALMEAQDMGLHGMKAETITKWVRDRYWPDAPSSSVGPTAWRMARDNRLVRVGDLYALPPATAEKVMRNGEARNRLTSLLSEAMRKASDETQEVF